MSAGPSGSGAPPPSLYEAFEALGPLQDPELARDQEEADRIRSSNRERERAAARIQGELTELAGELERWKFQGRGPLIEDAAQDTLINLATRGARTLRGADPQRPEEAERVTRGYLRRALYHNVLSLLRREREDPLPSEVVGDEHEATELAIDLDRAKWRLFQEVVPSVANGKRTAAARDGFLQTIAQLHSIATGSSSFDDVVQEEVAGDPGEAGARDRAVNRLHQRYSRALSELEEGVSRFAEEQGWSDTERAHLVRWLDWLRLGSGRGE